MKALLNKLNYKGSRRIAIINSDESFVGDLEKELDGVIIDRMIDQRCPYEFMIIFVRSVDEVDHFGPIALHNLTADGVLWFCYPKKSSKLFSPGLERDHGWKSLNEAGFHGIRMVALDNDWAAMRFRNIRYIKSSSNRFNK